MRLSFYLDKPQSPRTAVMINVAVFGQRLRFCSGISLETKHWNDDRQAPRLTNPHINVNPRRLKSIESFMVDLYRQPPLKSAEAQIRCRDVSIADSVMLDTRIQSEQN